MDREAKQRYIESLEPERYELYSAPTDPLQSTRRDLVQQLGSGLLLVWLAPHVKGAPGLSARVHAGEDGIVTVFTGKVELGQGARTLLTQAAAEELGMAPAKVRLVMGDTDVCPDDGGTWASLTTPETVPMVRRACAAARVYLAKNGTTAGPLPEAVSENIRLVPPQEWKTLGSSQPAMHGREIVTGKLKYSGDFAQPEMLHGAMVRSPHYSGTLTEAPASVHGTHLVRYGNFLGIIADTAANARAAAARIQAQWKPTELPTWESVKESFRSSSTPPKPGTGGRYPALIEAGDIRKAMEAATQRFEETYDLGYIAHVALEPRSATAQWADGRLTVWLGTQAPFLVRQQLAEAFRLQPGAVRVVALDLGAGFGGKQGAEVALEAARLAKDAGAPVKLAWSREEEFEVAYFRPAGVLDVRTSVDAAWNLSAWEFRNYNSGAAGIRVPYRIPNLVCAFHRANSPFRQGSYRSLAGVANTFARESHLEEVALRLKQDPVAFRLRHLDDVRGCEVLERCAKLCGWGKRREGEGLGLAFTIEKDARLACAAKISFDSKKRVRVERMWMVFDCGAVLNPDNLKNQITGAMIQGIGGALWERIRWDRTRVINKRLSTYPVPRFLDAPQIEVLLIDRREVESAGAGEAPITLVAPALASALRNATGKRVRSLPLLDISRSISG